MEEYDFIVVGAGSAGCAVAARLTERPGLEVLILEAGGADSRPEFHIPAAFPHLFQTPFDWGYRTVPQAGLNGRQEINPRGKVVGGSSSINAMIFMRGNPHDYNRWAALGNAGWAWDDLMPYFRKTQHQQRGESAHHGVGGPIYTSDLRDPNPLSRAFVEAATQAGYAPNDDFNAGEQTGFGLFQVTQKDGMRCSAADGYLRPALERTNLTAITEAHVTQLLIKDGRCVGVAYLKDGETYQARARHEVILSGGAINSPQVLMLSGIGPAAQLRRHGIAVQVDLPGVGQHLQDHMFVPIAYHCTQPITLANAESPEQVALFQHEHMGMLTSNLGEAGGFIDLGLDGSPELQFIFGPLWFIHHGAGNPAGHGYTLLPGVVRPHSVGSVTLASANPLDKALVDPNYYGDPRDLELMKQGVAVALTIAGQPAFAPYRGEQYLPGSAANTPETLENFIRDNTMTLYHPVGTCKMGQDELAVVDATLKVRGIAGLRVADASIMPLIINANCNIPTMVIGEKCADLILQELSAPQGAFRTSSAAL
ncbi:GMC family oxidoreductase [Hymenobacter terricola]|uniref:GMC family oxidoreductase n=1 Tax=Hymenobacter terricola TaxID=2819236 RepID=UPI001B30F1D9|nr:GMC family oxidoreductase N-terminal domain-containing protein [Hymenobacter terricola]